MSKRIEIAYGVETSGFVTTHLTASEYEACESKIGENVTVSDSNKEGKDFMLKIAVDIDDMREKFEALTVEQLKPLALKEYRTRGYGDEVRKDLLSSVGLSTSTVNKDIRELKNLEKNDPEKFALLMTEAKSMGLLS